MITIVFVGLIAHVLTSGGTQRAVLIAAPTHAARMIVRADDVVEAQALLEIPSPIAGERVFDLAGEHLSLETGAHAATIRTQSMRAHIVSLSAISDATALRDEVERGEIFGGVSSYLDLDGGTLDTDEQSVTREIAYRLDQQHRNVVVCASWGVRFTAPFVGDSITFRGAGGAILRLRPGSAVRVENLPPTEYRDPHFHACTMILKNVSYIASPAFTGRSCDESPADHRQRIGQIRSTAAMTPLTVGAPDCTITQWP